MVENPENGYQQESEVARVIGQFCVCGGKSVKDNQLTEFLATQQQQQQQGDSRLIVTKKRGSQKPLIAVRSSVQHCQPLRNCALP